MNIELLEPTLVWKHFAAICRLPHPSGHEEAVRKYLIEFARTNALPVATDTVGNVLIRKPASSGLSDAPVTVLQCHLDMVPQKNNATAFDFLRDPIQPRIDGDWVAAQGTTLGADNGIGVAAALATLEDRSLYHGQLHALFTVEEETGLKGANGVEPAFLAGNYLINLDSEEEGIACIGCAGGARTDFIFNADQVSCPADCCGIELAVSGLKGGHSGMDINRGRGNAIRIMFELLTAAAGQLDLRLSHCGGGGLDNAIPREASAVIAVPTAQEAELFELAGDFLEEQRHRLHLHDPGLKIALHRVECPLEVLDRELQKALCRTVLDCPNGPISFSPSIPDLVETSSNLASVKMADDVIKITTSQRSAVDQKREELIRQMSALFSAAGAECVRRTSYPGWPPEPKSRLNTLSQQTYRQLFQRELELAAIHAGLECGIFKGKNPHLEMISIGPDIIGAHSPDERVRIESVKNFRNFLTVLLHTIATAE